MTSPPPSSPEEYLAKILSLVQESNQHMINMTILQENKNKTEETRLRLIALQTMILLAVIPARFVYKARMQTNVC